LPNSHLFSKTNWDTPGEESSKSFWTRVQPRHLHCFAKASQCKHTFLQKRIFVNNQIRAREVRLIDEKGIQVGVVSLEAALSLAKERGYDVIQVTEKVEPPVCKLADYGKYLYQQGKKERQYKKQQGGGLKEVRLTFNISLHDMETRAKQAEKFLLKGDRVRVALRLRGREKALKNFAKDKAEKFVEMLNHKIPVKVERGLQEEPRGLAMLITKQ